MRSARRPVATARKISPLPWCPVEPVLASPSPARLASRTHAAESSGASVTVITMHEPAGGAAAGGAAAGGEPASGAVAGGAAAGDSSAGGSIRPTGTPSIVSRSCSPKFDITSTPTTWPDGVSREAEPMPPLKPRQLIPVPDPTAPSAGAGPPMPALAASSAARTSAALTCIRRASDRKLSSHSATTGMMTSSAPIAGSSSISSSQAAS